MPDDATMTSGRQRLEAAVTRLEATVARLASAQGASTADTRMLREQNERLQATVREALSRIDRLLAGG